jgi:HAD superfamily hydrolase (TIGR01662 family)
VPYPFKAVVFDLGNTLIHFTGVWPEVMARADAALLEHLLAAGLGFGESRFLPEFRARLNAYYQERESELIEHTTLYFLKEILGEAGYSDLSEDILKDALREYYAISQDHWLPEDDALPTLETLKKRGYRLGLVSNAADDSDVQTLVDKARIRPYFDLILTSAAQSIRKPDPRIFEPLIETWGLAPGQIVMVGDTLGADILGAQNAGLFSIWITRRADTLANQVHQGTIRPDAVIDRLADLPALLDRLSNRRQMFE